MGASVRPIPVRGRDLIARAVAPQSTRVGAEPWTGYQPSAIEQALTFPLALATNPVGTTRDAITDTIRDAITALVAPGVGERPHDPRLSKGGNSGGMTMPAMQTPYTPETGGVTSGQRLGAVARLVAQAVAPDAMQAGTRGVGALARALDGSLAPDVMDGIPVAIQRTAPGPVDRALAADAAWRQRFLASSPAPAREGPPWPAPDGFVPSVDRPSIARAVMDSVATMPLKGTKVVDAEGNPRVVYHGTSAVFDKFDPNKLSPDALYGPGIYHTENPTVAGGTQARIRTNVFHGPFPSEADAREEAADISRITGGQTSVRQRPDGRWEFVEDTEVITGKKGYANKGEGEAPNIRPARLAITNPFDADAPVSGAETSKIIDALQQRLPSGYTPMLESLRTGYGLTGVPRAADLYDMLARTGADRARVNAALKDAGYDGITHIGGANTGTAPHRVWIAFDPSQVRSAFDPIESARQVGAFLPPIALGAGAATRPGASPRPTPR